MLDPVLERAASHYVASADRVLPGRITGFYLVGSSALGAFRAGRSDIDFVAALDGEVDRGLLRRLRLLHVRSGITTGARAVRRGQSVRAGTLNGVFVRSDDLSIPVTEIPPVASQTGTDFAPGRGGDVNPVVWKVLAESGITVRGPRPESLDLDPQPDLLRSWNLDNLRSYWRPWAAAVLRAPRRFLLHPRSTTAWGVLGAPRLHRTIATGEVVSKEAAGEHALDVLPAYWHPLIHDALAHWRMEQRRPAVPPATAVRRTAELVLNVHGAAEELCAGQSR